jgi:hypothetical protein
MFLEKFYSAHSYDKINKPSTTEETTHLTTRQPGGRELTDKLQQAITLVKSGDKQNGMRLLAEIIKADPRNEAARL